jgi:hypothetical protein
MTTAALVGPGHQFGRPGTATFKRERVSQQRSELWFRQMPLCGGCFSGSSVDTVPHLLEFWGESEVPVIILLMKRSMAHVRWATLSGVQ